MREDLEALLELQRKTKAGEVAPLVDVAIKHFWPWPGKAYRAYQRKGEIAIEQLELRRRVGFPKDERVANVVTLFSQLYDEASWMEGGETFSYVMAEDAWQMVDWLVDYLSWDDLGSFHFFDKVDQQYGILTSEEFEFCDRCKTVGEVADFLTKIASEGREKASPRHTTIGPGCGICVAILFAVPLALICVAILFAVPLALYWFAFANGLGGGHSVAAVFWLVFLTVLLGSGMFLGIRNAVRRWREMSKTH